MACEDKCKGKTKYLGIFDDEEEAAKAFDAEARRVRGARASSVFHGLKLR